VLLVSIVLVLTSSGGRWRVEEIEDETRRLPAAAWAWHAELFGISRTAEQRGSKGNTTSRSVTRLEYSTRAEARSAVIPKHRIVLLAGCVESRKYTKCYCTGGTVIS
jgi:hypothetical protein